MSSAPDPTLSVVVVTRNEAEHVDDCLRSIFELCEGGPSTEVLLVDSNSSDDSVDRAASYPITVLRIPSDDLASPSAGRFVGTEYARGEYILFVDGDMRLETGWLEDAMAAVERPGVVGVTGHLNDSGPATEPEPVDALRGVALYDASVLETVGGFDPFLQSSEDVDVGFRLVAAGYRLVRLPVVVATHRTDLSIAEPLRRWRRGYFHGVGQAVRKASDDPAVLGRHVFSLRHSLFAVGWALVGLALVAVGVDRRLVLGWMGLTVVGLGGYTMRTGPRRLLIDSCSYLLTTVGLVLGARQGRFPAESFPLDDVELVKRSPETA